MEMVIDEENGTLRVQTLDAAVRDVQSWFARFSGGESWSEELLRERRAEAEREQRTETEDRQRVRPAKKRQRTPKKK
jgi:hypothetical protein